MLSRSSRRKVAQLMLGAMLFAQAAIAAAACDWLRVAPAQALMAKAGEPTCHDEPARNANLCLTHCLGSDQSADTPQVATPAWSQAYFLVIADVERAHPQADLRYTLPRPGAPPPRILFQSFLI
jgi:hypothetical protein